MGNEEQPYYWPAMYNVLNSTVTQTGNATTPYRHPLVYAPSQEIVIARTHRYIKGYFICRYSLTIHTIIANTLRDRDSTLLCGRDALTPH